MTKAKRRYWLIVGHQGTRKIFERKVPVGYLSEKRLDAVLKTLVAKAGLDFDDIVSAYMRSGSTLLEIQREPPTSSKGGVSCGVNPYFTAHVVDE